MHISKYKCIDSYILASGYLVLHLKPLWGQGVKRLKLTIWGLILSISGARARKRLKLSIWALPEIENNRHE